MSKFFGKAAVLIFLAALIEPASASGAIVQPYIPHAGSTPLPREVPHQSPANPYGPGGDSLQGAQPTLQGAQPTPQGAQPTPRSVINSSRTAGYCAVSGGGTCQTLNPPGSYCECRDNFGRHFNGVAR
jgi:hypothetical protein